MTASVPVPAPLRAALATALAVLVLVAAAAPAAAHAVVRGVEPADGARLQAAPDEVSVEFNEPVSIDLGGLRVFAANGGRADAGAPEVDGTTVRIALRDGLAEGTYAVTWRVVSADGHSVKGGSVFAVGATDPDRGALAGFFDDDADRPWELAGAVARALAYGGALLAAGGGTFAVVVQRRGATAPERRRRRRHVAVAAGVAVAGALAQLPVQAALGTGSGAGAVFEDGVLGNVLDDGTGWALGLLAGGLLVVLLALSRGVAWLVLAGAATAAGSFTLTGHTRVTDPEWLAHLADVVHLWAVAVWGGGLWFLWWTLRQRRPAQPPEGTSPPDASPADASPSDASLRPGDTPSPEDTVALVTRFSRLALGVLVVVVATGGVLSWTQVRAVDALSSTTYGWVLVAKVATVVAIVAVAAYNRFRLVPALTGGTRRAALARLTTSTRLEALAMVPVVALTAALVNITPAATAAGLTGVVDTTVELGDVGSVQVVVDPAEAGFNEIHLYTFDPTGRPTEIAESVTLALSQPDADIGPIARDPYVAGPAHLQLDGTTLAVAGRWEIEIIARVDEFTEVRATAVVPVRG